ncbi:hypothetical protein PMI14_01326 [Acidovorax sp. CF316]|uniref:hypothetical protein n=1 Tax=Acidovorax sp. CF316 TaxID=1144317 RepID=UPI00026BC6B0|nr:hypothetical protein [Acidovorax sp. CF316]EJE53775.1 hypothetical protein PMI14_01326 [Acidovorax sp. CF316]
MIDVLILAGLLHITVPATAAPQQYLATAYALPGQQLQWRGRDNWVAPHLCFDRCGTVPGQPNVLLAGGLGLQDAADLQLTVWRLDGTRWTQVMHCANFFTGPHCGTWGQQP